MQKKSMLTGVLAAIICTSAFAQDAPVNIVGLVDKSMGPISW